MSQKQRFWKLENPYWAFEPAEYDHIRAVLSSYRNGIQQPLYSIPGVICPQCKDWSLVCEFPFSCPESLVDNPFLKYAHVPLALTSYRQLLHEIEVAFSVGKIHYTKEMMNDYLWLTPGAEFADKEFKIGCPPPFHFLWAELGRGPTIKQEVKEALVTNRVIGVTFHEVNIAFVGKGAPDEIPFYHAYPEADPNDISAYFSILGKMDEKHYDMEPELIEPHENPPSYGPLYYMRVSHWGPDWEDWTKPPTCKLCGNREQPEKPEGLVFGREHVLDGHDIFRSAVAGGIVVSKKVHDIIMDHKFTNVHLTELPLDGG